MEEPYLRFCRPCDATHLYEMPFRLAALRAGLELWHGTSPPVLEPVSGLEPAAEAPARLQVIRAYLHLLGPATPKHVADYLDAPVKDVKAHWPEDAVEVEVDGETRWMLADDEPALDGARPSMTRLLGPFDLFLQAKDRGVLVDDPGRAKALWPVLGRPGAVLHDGELAGLWRPRKSGTKLTVQVTVWGPATRALRSGIEEQSERLAQHRGARLAAVELG